MNQLPKTAPRNASQPSLERMAATPLGQTVRDALDRVLERIVREVLGQ